MHYYFKPAALRGLKKLPKSAREKIVRKLDFYAGSPDPLKFAKAMQDEKFGEYRFRAGDYRIVFDFDAKRLAIFVLAVGHRKDIYK